MKAYSVTLLFLVLSSPGFSQGCTSGDCKNGYGVYTWSDGEKFEGDWKNGKQDGKGTYFYSNGSKYIGGWKNGKKEGEGVFIKLNGNEYEGIWEQGKRVVKTNTLYKDWLLGTWEGKGYQLNGDTWKTILHYNSKDDIKINYPDFPCNGYWYFDKENSHQIFFKEKITVGQNNCVVGVDILIEKVSENIMGVYFFSEKKQIASANLVREK